MAKLQQEDRNHFLVLEKQEVTERNMTESITKLDSNTRILLIKGIMSRIVRLPIITIGRDIIQVHCRGNTAQLLEELYG